MAVFGVQERCLGCGFWWVICGKIHNCNWLSISELRTSVVAENGTV